MIVGYTTCYRGERKVGNELEAAVRRREATAACQIFGARPHSFDYAHEKLQADEATLEAVSAWLKQVQPDIVVTHWPLPQKWIALRYDTYTSHGPSADLVPSLKNGLHCAAHIHPPPRHTPQCPLATWS